MQDLTQDLSDVIKEIPDAEYAQIDTNSMIDIRQKRINKLKSELDSDFKALKERLQADVSEIADMYIKKGIQPYIRLNSSDINVILKYFYSKDQEFIDILLTPIVTKEPKQLLQIITLHTYKNIDDTENTNQNL